MENIFAYWMTWDEAWEETSAPGSDTMVWMVGSCCCLVGHQMPVSHAKVTDATDREDRKAGNSSGLTARSQCSGKGWPPGPLYSGGPQSRVHSETALRPSMQQRHPTQDL